MSTKRIFDDTFLFLQQINENFTKGNQMQKTIDPMNGLIKDDFD